MWRRAPTLIPAWPCWVILGKPPPSRLGSLPAPRRSLDDVEGSCRVQIGLELEGVMGSAPVGSSSSPSPRLFQKHRARSKSPALRIGRRAWKECKHVDIFKLFPAPVIRTLEERGPEVSPALNHKERNNLEISETPSLPISTSTQASIPAWASGLQGSSDLISRGPASAG